MSDLDDESLSSGSNTPPNQQPLPDQVEVPKDEVPGRISLDELEEASNVSADGGEVILSPSAHYVRLKVEHLGQVDSFRGISMSDTPATTAEEAEAQAKVERALRRLLAFARSPGELATFVATEVHVTKLKAGEALCVVGEPADSMMVLVDGYAQIYGKDIGAVGVLGPGASLGEAALLGLLHVRTATVQAVQDCAVVEIRQELLERVKFRRVKESLLLLAYERFQQSQQRQPLASLPMGIPSTASNLASLVALMAERMDLPPGEAWWPLPDSHPSGPHFGVLVTGLAHLELSTGRYISRIRAGSYVPEGLLAEHHALLRAASNCLAYRIPQYDFLLAVGSHAECRDWYDRCREHESLVRQALAQRLRNATKAAASASSRSASRSVPSPCQSRGRIGKASATNVTLKDLPTFPVEESSRKQLRRRKPLVGVYRGDPRAWRSSSKSRSYSNEVPSVTSTLEKTTRSSKMRSDSQGALPVVRPKSGVALKRFTHGLGAPGDLYYCTSSSRRPMTR